MVIAHLEKMPRVTCILITGGTILLALVAIVLVIVLAFYRRYVYSISTDLCPRNVPVFDDYLCAGRDIRNLTSANESFSAIFGAFSPLSRNVEFRLRLGLLSSTDAELTYSIYKIEQLGPSLPGPERLDSIDSPSLSARYDPCTAIRYPRSTLGSHYLEFGKKEPKGPKPSGWVYVLNNDMAWLLLETRSVNLKLHHHPPPHHKPDEHKEEHKTIRFYHKEGVDDSYYKIEISTLVFDDINAVSSITLEAVPGSKEYGTLSVIIICLGMAIGIADFIHLSWNLRHINVSKFAEIPNILKLSTWMSICCLFSFTPLSLIQYFDDNVQYTILNSAAEQISVVGSILLLTMAARYILLTAAHDASAQNIKLFSFFSRKLPVVITTVIAIIGSISVSFCRINPALGKTYTTSSYIFAILTAACYTAIMIFLLMTVCCMGMTKRYMQNPQRTSLSFHLVFGCILWEVCLLIADVVYVIWHFGYLQLYEALHFNNLLICFLFSELLAPVSGASQEIEHVLGQRERASNNVLSSISVLMEPSELYSDGSLNTNSSLVS